MRTTILSSIINVDPNKFQIFVHSTLDDLHKHVSKSILPAEYGGEIGPMAAIAGE